MTNEEKKAIEIIKFLQDKCIQENGTGMMPIYRIDDLANAIKILLNLIENQYNEIEELKKYEKYYEEMHNQKPELEYYKSSKKYDYYIEKPYKQMYFYDNKVKFKKYGYSARGEAKNGSSIHFCLALCGYSKEQIIEKIENHIIQDNLEE